ncbi:Hydroxyproline O-arabinosyltransferase 3 [Camellia lanceoleosa]|uniref:Hydroxyproline O-arabinosyltransferase 3 n=1 Tax=Camellia lanceoleosa TaxID=1840588 RepID=A0ACC0FNI3_9ERIC|nr:Hydroxyproline O-arabinosyltransferase 3 [Camellia lanceoleosa]
MLKMGMQLVGLHMPSLAKDLQILDQVLPSESTDAPYSKWQCQIMYYWYKKVKAMPGSDMGGFTRVLHSGNPDNLMEEILTFVVDPFPDGLDWK